MAALLDGALAAAAGFWPLGRGAASSCRPPEQLVVTHSISSGGGDCRAAAAAE